MAQEQYALQSREYDNVSKRNQQLHDQYTRLDIACNHANEELTGANGHIERLRNECANLRAEKKIWEVRRLQHVLTEMKLKMLTTECPNTAH